MNVYNLSKDVRKEKGLKGREWALSDEAGFTSEHMAKRVISNMDVLFNDWKPREKYELIKVTPKKLKSVPHNLVY